jgi:two-component system KDP operon response regulator KdpE
MRGARILVVDDDPAILRVVGRALTAAGYSVRSLDEGATVVETAAAFLPDVVLLDLLLPDAHGVEICRQLRARWPVPIIVLSAIGEDQVKVAALDEGADDYLTKPFSLDELLARIRVALRRAAGQGREPVLAAGPLVLDVAARTVKLDGRDLHLTPHEFGLLKFLLQNRGKVLTQREILRNVWGPEYGDEGHILRTFVHQLRAKLGVAGQMIVTDPGVGYRFTTER